MVSPSRIIFDTKIRDGTDRSFVDFFSSRQRNDEAVWTESIVPLLVYFRHEETKILFVASR